MFITETMPIAFSNAILYIFIESIPYSFVETYTYAPRYGQIWPRSNK